MAKSFTKQPKDRFWIGFDFEEGCTNASNPEETDTVDSYTLKAYLEGVDVTDQVLGRLDRDGPAAGAGRMNTWHFLEGYIVYFLACAGEDAKSYKWECVAETNSGQTIDMDLTMKVKES